MRPQHRTSHHDEQDAPRHKRREIRHMPRERVGTLFLSLRSLLLLGGVAASRTSEELCRRRAPVDGRRPVADECENADGHDVEAADTVVGA